MRVRRLGTLLFALALPQILHARVISYAPVTSQLAIPAVQSRTNRTFALVELDSTNIYSYSTSLAGSLVLYDSRGEREPQRVLPKGSTFTVAATFEGPDEVPYLFVGTDANLASDNAARAHRYLLSTDGGASWRTVPLPAEPYSTFLSALSLPIQADGHFDQDTGGPFVRGRRSPVRPGNAAVPFVFMTRTGDIYGVTKDAAARLLYRRQIDSGGPYTAFSPITLAGSNAGGTQFLFVAAPTPATDSKYGVYLLDLLGQTALVAKLQGTSPKVEGWITAAGGIYLETEQISGSGSFVGNPTLTRSISFVVAGITPTDLASAQAVQGQRLFAVPTSDYSGAWIVQRGNARPTTLSLHKPGSPIVEQWQDVTAPEVEALHPGRTEGGKRLLVQVHRPRPQVDQRLFKDPALAVWTVGDPAPRRYDELFLVEQTSKGFVHVDVDAIGSGEPFFFDSGMPLRNVSTGGGPSGGEVPASGGYDVTQEWGVVRASLKQRLVIPAVARSEGKFGAFWKTDVLLSNPTSDPLNVKLRYLPSGEVTPAVVLEETVTLTAFELRILPDVLGTVFKQTTGAGALQVTAENDGALTATSRTYTTSPKGTYGMTVGAVDAFTAFSANFPATFAAALQGPDFRTNLVTTNVAGQPSNAMVRLMGDSSLEASALPMTTPPSGQSQRSGIGDWFGQPTWQTGGLVYAPTTGESIPAIIAIDNRTNDPTYFPPDVVSRGVRVIPALVHQDGAGGARFRSDLFLSNPSGRSLTVTLLAKLWTETAETTTNITLLPNESRVIRDALFYLFGKTGVARLRFTTSGVDDGVRVTSRTYTLEPGGGTYGLLIPPLNSFQSATSGESLEILGAQGGAAFRTNLSLVELTAFGSTTAVTPRVRIEVIDDQGRSRDSFEVNLPLASGLQIDDLFRTRGLGDGPPVAILRITPTAGLVGAYATVIDRGTNDPAYLPAALGARP